MPYLVVRHQVQDYGKWKPIFDEHEKTRQASGCRSTRLFRSADNPNEVVVLLEWDSLDNARRFAQSEDLRKTMERAGVMGKPDLYFLDEIELGYKRAR